MGFADACTDLARELGRGGFVEIFTHHDADGIAAGAIMAAALFRAGKQFRITVRSRVTPDDLKTDETVLLIDLGASLADLPDQVMVIDHHLPLFRGGFHVNPRLHGIDGDFEISSAGTAFLVAQGLGDNRDLAGLVLAGIIGDGQGLSGPNRDIVQEGVAQGIIGPGFGILLPGRDLLERLYLATTPVLPGISGNHQAAEDLLKKTERAGEVDMAALLSLTVLETATTLPSSAILSIFGETFQLEREVVPDARSLAAVIDGCGKAGHGALALSVCLRDSGSIQEAWELTRRHRTEVINAFFGLVQENEGVFSVKEPAVASDVADAVMTTVRPGIPFLVSACRDGICRVSARSVPGSNRDIGEVVRALATEAGGFGGGHRTRGGATFPSSSLSQFITSFKEAVSS